MTRSNAREVAVHLIYEIDYTGEDPAQAIETRMDRSYYSGLSAENDVYAERPSKKQMDYIRTCVTGVCEHAEELDALIAQYAVRWNLHRISRLTKAAMRLAIYEMRYVDDVPNGVAINECVELTRKYEDAQVVSFVNGILGSVARGAKPRFSRCCRTSGFPPILWMIASSPGDIRVNGIIRSPSFSGIVISLC